jgi:hypothetical protein
MVRPCPRTYLSPTHPHLSHNGRHHARRPSFLRLPPWLPPPPPALTWWQCQRLPIPQIASLPRLWNSAHQPATLRARFSLPLLPPVDHRRCLAPAATMGAPCVASKQRKPPSAAPPRLIVCLGVFLVSHHILFKFTILSSLNPSFFRFCLMQACRVIVCVGRTDFLLPFFSNFI